MIRRPRYRRKLPPEGAAALLTLAVGLALALGTIRVLEGRLRPVIEAAARTQVHNQVTALLEEAVGEDLAQRGVSYGDLVEVQRDSTGAITSLATDMAALNLLRTQLTEVLLAELEGIDVSVIQVPLGTLFDSELIWARGPAIHAHALWVGTVSAEFESEFTSAGLNQTLHRLWLEVSVPLTVLLPGSQVEVPVNSRLCIAETVIVGQVPNTYLGSQS